MNSLQRLLCNLLGVEAVADARFEANMARVMREWEAESPSPPLGNSAENHVGEDWT